MAQVRLWQAELTAKGLAPSTVNQRLAACSSWYTFMGNERELVDGIEVSPFMDRLGRFRANPFHGYNIERAQVPQYESARALTIEESQALLNHLAKKSHTLTGSRNYALILTFLLTGYRNAEVVSMQWGKIQPNRSQPGAWVYLWKGKRGKTKRDPLPLRVYHAIENCLLTAGREPKRMGPEEYIFTPVVTHGLGNLRGQGGRGQGAGGHISPQQAEAILRTALRGAGIERAETVRVHDLRHTYAVHHYDKRRDVKALQERLHHESIATTQIYLERAIEEPIDDYSEDIYQGLFGR